MFFCLLSHSLLPRVSRSIRSGLVVRILNFLRQFPLKHLLRVRGGIDSPRGRENVSPSTDWIDNAGLNIALRQGGRRMLFLGMFIVLRLGPYLCWMTKWNYKEGAGCNKHDDFLFLPLEKHREPWLCHLQAWPPPICITLKLLHLSGINEAKIRQR